MIEDYHRLLPFVRPESTSDLLDIANLAHRWGSVYDATNVLVYPGDKATD
jgi:hypothetical protein